jgi:hypothetical protein
MRRKLTWSVFAVAILVTALYHAGNVRATPQNRGFVATTLAKGTFGEIDVFNHAILANPTPASSDDDEERDKKTMKNSRRSSQKTKRPSDLYVQSNVWQPGGSTGWHSHPGYSLIIVTAGTITDYGSDDRKCKPHVYTQGMGFVDSAGNHAHIIRNEGRVPAATIAVQFIPAGATRRLDAAAPANCANLE